MVREYVMVFSGSLDSMTLNKLRSPGSQTQESALALRLDDSRVVIRCPERTSAAPILPDHAGVENRTRNSSRAKSTILSSGSGVCHAAGAAGSPVAETLASSTV